MWYQLGLVTILIAVLTLPVGLLTALFVGLEAAAVVFIVGWFLLVPVLPLLGSLLESLFDWHDEPADPMTELKHQYAAGEIGEDEFVRRVERLIEVEDVEAGRHLTGAEPGSDYLHVATRTEETEEECDGESEPPHEREWNTETRRDEDPRREREPDRA